MKRVLYSIIILFIFLIFLGVTMFFNFGNVLAAGMNATMIVEADILGFNVSEEISDVGIEVSDYVYLGEVTKENPISEDKRVNITNIGKVNVTVTPVQEDSNDEIASYLQFRKRTRGSNPEDNVFYKIGDYSQIIPFKGIDRKSYCYISLDLTNFNGIIEESPYNYIGKILFLAMPQQN